MLLSPDTENVGAVSWCLSPAVLMRLLIVDMTFQPVFTKTEKPGNMEFFKPKKNCFSQLQTWFFDFYIDIANLPVCLSVRNVPVSDENGLTYRHSFFHHTVAQSF